MCPQPTPISLLLVTDSPDTCKRMAGALQSAPEVYRINRIPSADLAHGCSSAVTHLALIDGGLRDIGVAEAVQHLVLRGIPAVAMIDAQDVQTLQEVVLAGVTALVAKPFTDDHLWYTICTALERGTRVQTTAQPVPCSTPDMPSGVVVALFAPKRGCGTSVIAANLALCLQQQCRRGAVLVEVGEGGSSQAVLLNLKPERTLADLLARFDPDDSELLLGVLTGHASGLQVLLAPADLGVSIAPELLLDVVHLLQRAFDFVVIDVSAGNTSCTLAGLAAANAALILITPEMTSLRAVRQFLQMIDSTQRDVQPNIVLNRSNLAAGIPADAIRRHLKLQIAAEVPDDQSLVTSSINRGVPFVISDARSALARAIQKLALDLAPVDGRRPSASQRGLLRAFAPHKLLGRNGAHK